MGKQVVRHPASSARWPRGVKRPGSASAAAAASCGQVADYGALPLLTRDELSTGGSSTPPRNPPNIVTLGYLHAVLEGPEVVQAFLLVHASLLFASAFMLTCFPQALNRAFEKINGNAKLLPNVTLVLAMQTYHTQTDAVQKGIALLNRVGRYFVSGWALTVPSSLFHQTIPIDSAAHFTGLLELFMLRKQWRWLR